MLINDKCPCANKACQFWGKCLACKRAMKLEGELPVCQQYTTNK